MAKKGRALLVFEPAAQRIQERVANCSQTPAQLAAKAKQVDKVLGNGNTRRAKGTPLCSAQFDKATFGSLSPSEIDQIVAASTQRMRTVIEDRAQSMGLPVSEYISGL